MRQGKNLAEEHIFRDYDQSGTKLKRPGLDHLRDQAAQAAFDLVLLTAPDRLAATTSIKWWSWKSWSGRAARSSS